MITTLFLAAPPESYNPGKDTTRTLMEAGAARGAVVYQATHRDLEVDGGRVVVKARRLSFGTGESWFDAGPPERIELAAVQVVWFREDPPFDDAYLHATQLVELAGVPLCINDPAGLRAANEKLMALRFPELVPPTLVSRDPDRITAFLAQIGGVGVLKPLDGFGGVGVFRAALDDPNLRALLQTATQHGNTWTMVQQFLPAIAAGDMRILLWDGEVLGAFRRVPQAGEFRGNMAQGGTVHAAELGAAERAIVAGVAPTLAQMGLRLVGLDVIGGRLTEVNVTSPTGFQEVRKLTGLRPEEIVWDRVLAQVGG